MLVKLRTGAAPAARDVLDEMLGCHERIRRFTAMAGQLAAAPAAEVAEAAAAVLRYFSVALPLHAEDEDLSLAPRLLATAVPAELRAALEAMTREHEPIEATLRDLAPLWSDLAAGDPRPASLGAALDAGAARLDELFTPHLEKEERIIFPAARARLSPADLAAIRDELRARRAPAA
jgi:hemerythrin-like domain-containing protein